jgi:hypothetical protein
VISTPEEGKILGREIAEYVVDHLVDEHASTARDGAIVERADYVLLVMNEERVTVVVSVIVVIKGISPRG